MRDRLGQVGRPLVLRGLQLPHRLGEPGAGLRADAAAAGVDEVRHRPYPGLRGEQRLVERAAEPLGRLAFLGDAGQQPVQVGVGLGQPGEGAQRIGGAGALSVGDGLDRGVAGGAELVGVRGVALRQLIPGGLDAVLDVGDRRRQGGDRTVDVGRRAVDGVEQRTRLAERRLRRADGVDQPGLASHRPRHQVAAVGDVLVGEGQPLLGGFDIAGHRSQCGVGELVVQRGQRLLRRLEARGQIDHLLGHAHRAGRRVDHQIPQLLERVALGVEFAVGLGGRDDHPGQQVAALRRRLGDGVVEDLADVERLRQRRSSRW